MAVCLRSYLLNISGVEIGNTTAPYTTTDLKQVGLTRFGHSKIEMPKSEDMLDIFLQNKYWKISLNSSEICWLNFSTINAVLFTEPQQKD